VVATVSVGGGLGTDAGAAAGAGVAGGATAGAAAGAAAGAGVSIDAPALTSVVLVHPFSAFAVVALLLGRGIGAAASFFGVVWALDIAGTISSPAPNVRTDSLLEGDIATSAELTVPTASVSVQ